MTSVRQERGATAGSPKSGRATLRKTEILHGYRSFTSVISSGKTLVVRPVRLFYIVDRSSPPGVRVGFAVSRGIRGSVRRNRIKRLLRESFRLQKHPLLHAIQDQGNAVQGVLMYVGPNPEQPTLLHLDDIRGQVGELLDRLTKVVSEHT